MSDPFNVTPIPVSSKDQIAELRMSGTEEGCALSSFGVSFGHDGRSIDTQMIYRMPGLSSDSMLANGTVSELPSLIRIDVDGIEHLILSGARLTLRDPTLVSVLVEVIDGFGGLTSEVTQHLTESRFALKEKTNRGYSILVNLQHHSIKFRCEPSRILHHRAIHSQLQ
jgi:hypothetical protein